MICKVFLIGVFCLLFIEGIAQTAGNIFQDRCGTIIRLNAKFERNTLLRKHFEQQKAAFNKSVRATISGISGANRTADEITYTIPVVFHVVLTNPAIITDRLIQQQLDILNQEFSGPDANVASLPSYFKPLFGKSGLRFCLAQRTPDGQSTSGVERITTAKQGFSILKDDVKHTASGGASIWDEKRYFNIWICAVSGNVLGYATFPQDGDESEQGIVIDYRSLPGGSRSGYNEGKSMVHETGHYLNLYHIWGDDRGECTGTDYVDDTPEQANASRGCSTGIKTDNCTATGNGVMYQNYMDYSHDPCMLLFTTGQVARMEKTLFYYRASLLQSDGCIPVVQRQYDVELLSINQPPQRLCNPAFTPAVTVKNRGMQPVDSLTIITKVDGNTVSITTWRGLLAPAATTEITLDHQTATPGNHILSVSLSKPDDHSDEDTANNNASLPFQYYVPVAAVAESFEQTLFPPPGWDLLKEDDKHAWQHATGIAKTGTASVMIGNFENSILEQKAGLRLPEINIPAGVDSAFLSFQVAAAAYTPTTVVNNNWDTLEVLVSMDCGATYRSVYKKWGSTLVTRKTPTTTAFVPTASEWRKDSIDVSLYRGVGPVLFSFRNTNGNENNIYLDDIGLCTSNVNPFLKAQGFVIAPNPVGRYVTVQFYPQPNNLKVIELYNAAGQKMAATIINGAADNQYNFDLNHYASGIYIIRMVFTDNVIARKIVKY